MGTNTTALIRAWSMNDEGPELSDGFESALDIHAALSQRDSDDVDSEPAPERPPLLFKGADDENWRPLLRSVEAG